VEGLALLLLGSALLLLAWRGGVRVEGRSPRWGAPPAVTACFTLTLILWSGLGAREEAYVAIKTQTSMEGLATTINYELDRQQSIVERIANNWGSGSTSTPALLAPDAAPQFVELRQ